MKKQLLLFLLLLGGANATFSVNVDEKNQKNESIDLLSKKSICSSLNGASFQQQNLNQSGSEQPTSRKNRFGVNLGFGLGFKSIDMLTTTDDETSKISFGGGVCVGGRYGREFGKYFDLAFDLNYQISELRPDVKNASVKFRRGVFTVTPSVIIPLKGENKIKLGAGIQYYFSPNFVIETHKVDGGFDDTWKYDNKLGGHISAFWEAPMKNNWVGTLGIKWYAVEYKFKSGGDYFPTSNDLAKPKGSGIDIVMGICYKF